jgi:hypothetical protein
MNRDLLAAAAPKWIAIQTLSAKTQFETLAMWTEAIMDAIELDHQEPHPWEALYLTYAIHALVEGRHFAALRFAEMVLIDPSKHRSPRLLPDGPEPVKLADLRHAMDLLRARSSKP